ncbi:MAG: hypothetical protein Q7T18_09835, partial [Sedimentisphaerales bacterium]|nr:hypothetical protein [Sedimentisphaerales bacterium]
ACLYGLCSLLIKFWKVKSMLLFCSLTGLVAGLGLIAVVWIVFYLNFKKYPEQEETTLLILYFIGYPFSLITNLVPVYQSLLLTFLTGLNWYTLGMSIGLAKRIFMAKIAL